MKVGTIVKNFKEVYGGTLRIYDKMNHIADSNEPISKFAEKGVPAAEKFMAGPDLKILTFKKRLLDSYGIVAKIADSDDKKILDEALTLKEVKSKSGK
ncbi:MAG: hypothetical protein EAZ53_12135 [Bacteroidetes bacterium]|nr:MAG: hypothetical protein EAZ53_12135 [Bacteroidota bacterium]